MSERIVDKDRIPNILEFPTVTVYISEFVLTFDACLRSGEIERWTDQQGDTSVVLENTMVGVCSRHGHYDHYGSAVDIRNPS